MHVNMDPNFVDNMVNEVKSQGVFDAFRKDSMADVDTKPAYQNLKQRVENTVAKFLSEQKWTPELNKNQMREKLRKHIIEAGFLEVGVQRIVDQVVNPKIATVFQPRIEDIVYKYLGIEKPEIPNDPKTANYMPDSLTINTGLLPNDLEAVSPDSDKSNAKNDSHLGHNFVANDENEEEDDESPPFEPLEGQSPSKVKDEDGSNYSHLSGISGLTSHSEVQDEVKDEKPQYDKIDMKSEFEKNDNVQMSVGDFAQESQLSQVSSNSRLSIGSNEGENTKSKGMYTQESSTNVDISEEAQMPKFNENSNSLPPANGETLHFDIKKDEIKFEGTDRSEILPPSYQNESLIACEKKPEKNNIANTPHNVEEISNGSFNSESQNSTYFDDDSERGVLQIIEDPTQDISQEQSRTSSVQKPDLKEEKNSTDDLKVQNSAMSPSCKRKNETCPNTSKNLSGDEKLENNNKKEITDKSTVLQKNDDKTRSLKSLHHRSSSSSTHKSSNRSKDKKSDKYREKDRKSSSSDSKLSTESNYNKNGLNGRNSSQSSPRSFNSVKEISKTNGSSHHRSSSSSSKYSSSSVHKSDKNKTADKERDRRRDHDRSRDEKSSKSDKQKSKEYDDHSSEKNKRQHRKSTDSNDGDKKDFANAKGQKSSKSPEVGKSSNDVINNYNNLNNQDNSSHIADAVEYEVKNDINDLDNSNQDAEKSKLESSIPTIVENLNKENIELIIGSNFCNANKKNQDEVKLETENESFRPETSTTLIKENESVAIKKDLPEKNRFETLISPPPKKRKYDMNFGSTHTNIFVPSFDSSDEDGDINLFGFDIQEEQDNYLKVIKDYEVLFDQFFNHEYNVANATSTSEKDTSKFGSNISSQNSMDTRSDKNHSNAMQKRKRPTDGNKAKELSHTSITSEEFDLSGKSLTINCFDYDLVPNPPNKKKTKVVALLSTEILKSKISPTLSDSSVGSKENEFSEKNEIKKLTGGDSKKSEKKSNSQTLLTTQRYRCDDLYKPRLTLSQRSRRRALNNDIL